MGLSRVIRARPRIRRERVRAAWYPANPAPTTTMRGRSGAWVVTFGSRWLGAGGQGSRVPSAGGAKHGAGRVGGWRTAASDGRVGRRWV